MLLNDIELHLVALPRTDGGPAVRSLLVRLVAESGVEGWGEAALPWVPSELPARRAALRAVLDGRDVFNVEELAAIPVLKHPGLRAAIETAAWDIIGRLVGQPLCRLWGGEYRPGLPVVVRLPSAGIDRIAEVGWALAEQGWWTQLVSAWGKSKDDAAMVAALRARCGSSLLVRVDGGCRMAADTADELCMLLEREAVEFVIDPLQSREFYAIAALARKTTVPLAAWRSIGGPADVLAVVRSGAMIAVVIDVERVGGPTAARKCAAIAEAAGVRALIGGAASVGIATALKLHLAASTPALGSFCECAYTQLQDDVLPARLAMMDGMLLTPRGPGLGITVDREKLEQYAVG